MDQITIRGKRPEKDERVEAVELVTFRGTFPEISVVPPVSKDRSVA